MRSLPKELLVLLVVAVVVIGVVVTAATDHLGTAVVLVGVLQGLVAALIVLGLRGQRSLRLAVDRRAAAQKKETDAWLKGIDRTLANLGELVVTESQATLRELKDS